MNSEIKQNIKDKFHNEWFVPDFKVNLSNRKKSKYCLIIPVINEGKRLEKLIKKFFKYGIHKSIDIIIVDGGSIDNSIKTNLFKSFGVNTILIKNYYGKLSSQLQIGYAFGLVKNYEFFITMDGNGKDDPREIYKFLNAFNDGYQFVQGSRFIKGAKGVNTPLFRLLAIKFIHAPVCSIASGFMWTDTTQGFRGYSNQILRSSKLKIFRPIFRTYELLCYLSINVPKLGFKCIEVPTTRTYPKKKIPTKIVGFKDYFSLLQILFKSAFGLYNL